MTRPSFPRVKLALLPVVFGCDGSAALAAAQALAAEVVLVGLVPITDGRPLRAPRCARKPRANWKTVITPIASLTRATW